MKKKFLKIVLGLFIFLGINNYGFTANVNTSGEMISDDNVIQFVAHPSEPLIYYVAYNTNDELKILNYETNEIINTGIFITKGRSYNLISNIYNNEFLFNNKNTGKINKFNILSNSISETYDFNLSDRGYVFYGDFAYFLGSKSLLKRELSTGDSTLLVNTDKYQFGININYNGSLVYFRDTGGADSSYNVSTGEIVATGGNGSTKYGQSGYGYQMIMTSGYDYHFVSDTQNYNFGQILNFSFSYNKLGNFLFTSINKKLYKYELDSGDPSLGPTCETKTVYTTDEHKFDYNYKEEYTTYIDYLHNNREEGLVKYGTDSSNFAVSITNIEDLYGFSGSVLSEDSDLSFSFNSLESPFSDLPTLMVTVEKGSYTNYFRINSIFGSQGHRVFGLKGGEIIDFLPKLENEDFTNFDFNKLYYFKNIKDFDGFLFEFEKEYNNIDLNIDFGKIVKEDNAHEVCVNSDNEIETVDGEAYSGSIDDIGQLPGDETNLQKDNTYVTSSVNSCGDIAITGIVPFFQYIGCYIEKVTTGISDTINGLWEFIDTLMSIGKDIEHKDILSLGIFNYCNAGDNIAVNSIFNGINGDNTQVTTEDKFLFNIYHFIKYFLYFIVFLLLMFLLGRARE